MVGDARRFWNTMIIDAIVMGIIIAFFAGIGLMFYFGNVSWLIMSVVALIFLMT